MIREERDNVFPFHINISSDTSVNLRLNDSS